MPFVVYPAWRMVPTDDGPQLRLEWVVRAVYRGKRGWLTAVAKVAPAVAIPVALKLIRASRDADTAAELFDHLAAVPGVRFTKTTAED